jgi:hypothetical protein
MLGKVTALRIMANAKNNQLPRQVFGLDGSRRKGPADRRKTNSEADRYRDRAIGSTR